MLPSQNINFVGGESGARKHWNFTGLVWSGLGWSGLEWYGLDWYGLDWSDLAWPGLVSITTLQ